MKEKPAHQLANLVPSMTNDEFVALKNSIGEVGLLEPIVLFEDAVLDGRHRQAACIELGVKPRYTTYKDDNAPLFVVGKNLARRNLNESQLGLTAGLLATATGGGDRQSKKHRANLHSGSEEVTLQQAADTVGVSRRLAATGKKVAKEGTSDLVAAVRDGIVSLHDAESVLDKPKEVQKEAVAVVRQRKRGTPKTVKGAAKKIAERQPPSKEEVEERNFWRKLAPGLKKLEESDGPFLDIGMLLEKMIANDAFKVGAVEAVVKVTERMFRQEKGETLANAERVIKFLQTFKEAVHARENQE